MLSDTGSASTSSSRSTQTEPRDPASSRPRDTKPIYIELPTDEARRLKWLRGREVYGDTFVGHPLLELDEELLDAMNYCEEARRWGWDLSIIEQALSMARAKVREVYASA